MVSLGALIITTFNIGWSIISSHESKKEQFTMSIMESHLNLLNNNNNKIKDFYKRFKTEFTDKNETILELQLLTKLVSDKIQKNR